MRHETPFLKLNHASKLPTVTPIPYKNVCIDLYAGVVANGSNARGIYEGHKKNAKKRNAPRAHNAIV